MHKSSHAAQEHATREKISPHTTPSFRPSVALTDDLARLFNTTVVSTKIEENRNFTEELQKLTQSASFRAILNAVQNLARAQGIQERQAAESIIQTFRKIDSLWGQYIFHEGLDKLRGKR